MDKTVFTNGCFDLLHPGHVDLLRRAKALGTRLVVGINSDASVRRIKGEGRPFMSDKDRAAMLVALDSVDEVVIFDELTPENIIKQIKPDVLVKGGDWKIDEIIGSDFVLANGGSVHSLPLLDGYSSTAIADGIRTPSASADATKEETGSIAEHLETIAAMQRACADQIVECAQTIIETVHRGGKIMVCGNGGSAADAQHLAAEFVGRYETDRRAIAAIALTTDTSALTAVSNDYGFERVFARQVEALASDGDLLIAISTSGESPNVIAAVMAARAAGCRVIGMTGEKGKKLASLSDNVLMVPSSRTARIQEAHITVAHIWCEMLDAEIARTS